VQTVPLHPAVERAAAQPQDLGDAGDVAVVVGEAGGDHRPLHFIQGHRSGAGQGTLDRRPRLEFGQKTKVIEVQALSPDNQDGSLYRLLELPYVPGPIALRQPAKGGIRRPERLAPVSPGAPLQEPPD